MLLGLISNAQVRFDVEINSFGEYDMQGKTFVIIPASERTDPTDLEFREYSSLICKALATAGAKESAIEKDADVCILMHYEITDHSYVESISIPIWGETGIRSVTTSTYATSLGITSTTSVNPSYGITGSSELEWKVSRYMSVINLYAYDNKETTKPLMLWKTNIVCHSPLKDIRKTIPPMSYVAMEGISSNVSDSYYIRLPHSSFDVFKSFKIRGNNIYPAPFVENFLTSELKVVSVEKTSNETVVTFFKTRNMDVLRISPNITLQYSDSKLLPIRAENIKLGKKIRNGKNMLFSIHFPAIPADVKNIVITEEFDEKIKNVQERKYWRGIRLEK